MPSGRISDNLSNWIKYERSTLYDIGKSVTAQGNRLNNIVVQQIKQLEIQRNKRGKRSGQSHVRLWDINQGVNDDNLRTLPQAIPTVVYNKRASKTNSNTLNINNIIQIKQIQNVSATKSQKNLKVCSINPRSVKNKTIAICDFILSNDFDIVAITETWLSSSVDKVCSSELVPNGYKMKQVPRPAKMRGGGVAIIYKSNINFKVLTSSTDGNFSTFEHIDCNIAIEKESFCLSVIYRPPPSQKNGLSTNTFLEQEWPLFLSKYATIGKPVIIVGDFNLHVDKLLDRDALKFISCLETFGLKQHVQGPTHVAGHTLDVVITRDTDNIVSNIEVRDPGLSDSSGKILRDHFAVIFNAHLYKPPPIKKTVSFRKFKSINIKGFREDMKSLDILNANICISDLDEYVESLNTGLSTLIDKHAPLITKTIVLRPSNPWFNDELHEAKHSKRKLERKWKRSQLTVDHEIYRSQCAYVNKLLKRTRISFYAEKIESCGRDQKTLFKVTKNLLGRTDEVVLPVASSSADLAQEFSDFFVDKIDKIRDKIRSETNIQAVQVDTQECMNSEIDELVEFTPVTENELRKVISKSQSKSCELDVLPTWLLKECLDELVPSLTKLINYSLDRSYVPKSFKSSLIRPLIKKPDLDSNILKNYRPVSNLPYVSKIIEKIVDSRLEGYLTANELHDPHQSAYRKFHSTETALIKVQK
ncbi:uncharacterized protein LOC132714233 [Ruditapes philippinarum]|uniref:uncharacterized protein LOC132714233 n=1 Tax=Ruditapes philippinarum TaxID=129788 RepID=UPI00295BA272|nr:uncharacterized protein LOC132714233 [Ruditapes philippinarum]